ncbi:hypothetical protein PVK06_003144 [Gossypium arboreum]|uniref:Uncharacterized protein n=1 Tax=Gossypium arboreum TaxID=29729 RepID=A0ABR0R5Q7_GOSAR|nr:hypothetical protein PVK06_003144 [Gossypium arboreum]
MANGRYWNVDRVNLLYGKYWGDRICELPTENKGQKDCMVWFHNPHGYSSSKTAYSWLLLKEMGYRPHRFFWKIIWKLDVLPKISLESWSWDPSNQCKNSRY